MKLLKFFFIGPHQGGTRTKQQYKWELHSFESASGSGFFDFLEFAASKGNITVSNAAEKGRSIKISGVSTSGGFNESPA
jgi:hypothetical protein